MAGPTVLGGGGGGLASLQQGAESIQNLAKFMEQKRQFDEEQARLNRMDRATRGWAMLKEIAATTDTHSLKEAAKLHPKLAAMAIMDGLQVDQKTAMSWVTGWANAPLNDIENWNSALSIYHRYGSGELEEDPAAAIASDIDRLISLSDEVLAKDEEAAPAAAPVPAAESPTGPSKNVAPAEVYNPSLALEELKKRLYGSLRESAEDPWRTGKKGGVVQPFEVVKKFKEENPQHAKAVDQWVAQSSQQFFDDVQAGKWDPSMAQGTTRRKSGASTADIPRGAETPVKEKPAGPAKELVMEPVSVEATADPLRPALKDYIASLTEGGVGRMTAKAKKLEKPLTLYMIDEMEKRPEGIEELRQNANWILNDPTVLRSMAMQQNAAAVYATDLEARGETVKSQMDAQKAMLELEKLGYQVKEAMHNAMKAGITSEKEAQELVLATVLNETLASGAFVHPDLAAQRQKTMDMLEEALKRAEAARAKGDEAALKTAMEDVTKWQKANDLMTKSVVEAMKASGKPIAQEYAKLFEQAKGFVAGKGIFLANRLKRGYIGTVDEKAKPVVISKEEADLSKELGF